MAPPGRKYIDSPSLQVFPPPTLCQDVTQYIFFLKGRQSKLQALEQGVLPSASRPDRVRR